MFIGFVQFSLDVSNGLDEGKFCFAVCSGKVSSYRACIFVLVDFFVNVLFMRLYEGLSKTV